MSRLYVALDQAYIGAAGLSDLMQRADAVGRLIGGLTAYFRGSAVKGARHRRVVLNMSPQT
jgi:hypothetical protein